MTQFSIYDPTIGSVTIRQITRTRYNPSAQELRAAAPGDTADSLVALVRAEPRVTIDTEDIAGVISGIPVSSGLYISAGSITIPWIKRQPGGTWASGTAHLTLTATNGLAIASSFRARGTDNAEASIDLALFSSDGLTSPVAANVNQSLAASSFAGAFGLGPVKINGTTIGEVADVNIDTGLRLNLTRSGGGPYPDFASLETPFRPRITITTRDLTLLDSLHEIAAALTSLEVYFRKRADGGTYEADGNLSHCKFSFGAGLTLIDAAAGDEGDTATLSLQIEGKTLTAASGVAIT